MKSPSQKSFAPGRTTLAATTLALLLGAPVLAQSGGAGSSSYGSTPKNPPADSSTYNSAAAPTDVDSAKEINAQTSHATAAGAMTGREHKLAWSDRRFVTKAADAGQDEVQLAQLAAERASNSEVKSFAQKLVDEHSVVNSELTAMAGQKNVKLDTDNDKDRAYKRLSKKSGSEFDQEFVEHMIDEHEKAIKMFEKASQDAKDPDVRAFASKHVDHLRDHLRQAESLRQTVMPTGRMDSSSGRSTTRSSTGEYDTSTSSATSTDKSTSSGKDTSSNDSTSSSTTPKRDSSR